MTLLGKNFIWRYTPIIPSLTNYIVYRFKYLHSNRNNSTISNPIWYAL